MDGWMAAWIDKWMNEWMYLQINGWTITYTRRHT